MICQRLLVSTHQFLQGWIRSCLWHAPQAHIHNCKAITNAITPLRRAKFKTLIALSNNQSSGFWHRWRALSNNASLMRAQTSSRQSLCYRATALTADDVEWLSPMSCLLYFFYFLPHHVGWFFNSGLHCWLWVEVHI
jgi:hypothetical protein